MKYCAKVAYSGENYNGFQRQKNKRSVQGEIEAVLSKLLGKETLIKGAGRTDKGVHAKGQTFSFESEKPLTVSKTLKALNRLLPEDIYILELREVPEDFDARHSCIGKVYEYCFTIDARDPLRVNKIAQLRRDDFKFEDFLQGLLVFEGRHNFQNFTTKPEDKDGFIRNVHIADVQREEEGNLVRILFKADGFMRYQIRLMVGAAIRVGVHRMTPEDIRISLESKQRKIVPFKAPAEGLTLLEVLYED